MNENLEKIENYIKLAEKADTVIYSNQFFPVSQLNNLKYYGIKFFSRPPERKKALLEKGG